MLAEKIDEILDELMAADGNPFSVPAVTPTNSSTTIRWSSPSRRSSAPAS